MDFPARLLVSPESVNCFLVSKLDMHQRTKITFSQSNGVLRSRANRLSLIPDLTAGLKVTNEKATQS